MFTGQFTYPGSIPNGTATGTTLLNNGAPVYTIQGMAADAQSLSLTIALQGDTFSVYQAMLAGNDGITGSAGNDTLCGFAGNDTVNGGAGTDLLVYSGVKSDYSITYNAATAASASPTRPSAAMASIRSAGWKTSASRTSSSAPPR